ncbi:MAG: SDR family oxidoreductase [Bacteroidales bacterium]|nr:SDR family oxidoreductase [Bacteroidales bacterium]
MKGKVVIITGASSGIGFACAKAFARKNCTVVLAARSKEKLEEVSVEINALGGKSLVVPTDVSLEEDCRRLIDVTIDTFGRIDILVNNAGISMRAILDDVETHVLHQVMDVNFWGTVYCTKYALPFLQQSRGTIVGISSLAGFHGLPGRCAYSASKFAMHGFLESVRIENWRKKVHVLIVAASFTRSNIRKAALNAQGVAQSETPKDEERLTSPERVARNVLRSIRKRKRTRIMSLQGQLMVFFQRIIPFLTDYAILRTFSKERNSPFK